ncbi:MAG: PorV/PorQ family protein [candidate division Zixibacteria bacterium]|nr:PorV/PorQ family protein [candidate division Zixibacteria bacterium]NIX58982.1 PorV/PorQ family protein [candidate division Zixibacteria bacterium]
MRYSLIIFLVLSLSGMVHSQNVDYAGTSAVNFLKIGVGARAMSMGDASITLAEDASALFWNPGAISRIPQNSVNLSTINWLVDTRVTYAGAILHAGLWGTFGIDLDFFSSGDIEETTLQQQDGTGRFFNASDVQVGISYGRNMTDRFSVGMKVKYIQERLSNVDASSFAFDIGAVFITSFLNDLRIGATLTNFGSKMKFGGRDLSVIYEVPGSPSGKEIPANLETLDWELPLLFRFGLSNYIYQNEDFSLLGAMDVVDSRDHDARFNVGGELGIYESLYVRGGYKFNYDETTFALGAGFNLQRILNWNANLDYSYLDFGRFDPVNQFSLVLGF